MCVYLASPSLVTSQQIHTSTMRIAWEHSFKLYSKRWEQKRTMLRWDSNLLTIVILSYRDNLITIDHDSNSSTTAQLQSLFCMFFAGNPPLRWKKPSNLHWSCPAKGCLEKHSKWWASFTMDFTSVGGETSTYPQYHLNACSYLVGWDGCVMAFLLIYFSRAEDLNDGQTL